MLKFCQKIFDPRVQNFIMIVIVINAITLGLETSPFLMSKAGNVLIFLDHAALAIFVIEILIKIIAQRFGFLKDPWNLFDFIVVGIALVPATGPLAILRALRIMRVLRLLNTLPRLRIIVESVFHALPSIGWIFALLLVVFYVSAVMGTALFGSQFQEWFGSIETTMYTLFQILTLDSWSMGIARPVMKEFPYAFLFFIPFVLLTSFVVLNVFIGIIVNTMSTVNQANKEMDKKKEIEHDHLEIEEEFAKLKNQMETIEALLKKRKEPL